MVYDYLKERNANQTQIKCNVGDGGAIGELVEEITINQPILVRLVGFFRFYFLLIGYSSMFQFNEAKFEDIKFFVYSVNDDGAEVETFNVSLNFSTHLFGQK